ncbi:MAG: dihydrodipicolinate synthase family protein, partial [Flavobacteriales bacterium]
MKSEKITGPVIPLPTPFTSAGAVDYTALKNYVGFLAQKGIACVMTTVGTSRFNLVTNDEVKRINEAVVEAGKGKLITIVANPPVGSLEHAKEFARHSESIGADYFLAYFPERYYGEENTFRFFNELNGCVKNTRILIHEMPMRNGLGAGQVQYSLPLLEQLLALSQVAGFKEEALDAEYSNKIVEKFNKTAIIIGAGGGMSRFLNRDHQRGAVAYLGGIGNFYPELELEFYAAIMGGNQTRASQIVNEIEIPYFNDVVPMGWHPSLKAALALKELLPPFER